MGKALSRFFASPKLAIVLIGVLLALGLVSFLVPQRTHADLTEYGLWKAQNPGAAQVAAAVQADDVFGSIVFFVVSGLLAINLTTCTVKRMRGTGGAPRVPTVAPATATVAVLGEPAEDAEATVRAAARGWLVRSAEDGERRYLMLDRTTIARWGSVVMHAGLLLVIIAGVVSGLTRFEGVMALTEGQTIADDPSAYITPPRLPLVGPAYSGAELKLLSVATDYEGSSVTQSHAQLQFSGGGSTSTQLAAVNSPARWGSKDYLLLTGGHAVRFSVHKGTQTLFEDSVVRLGEVRSGGYSDSVTMADGRQLAIATLANAGNPALAKDQPLRLADPVARFSLPGVSGQLTLHPGESGTLGDTTVQLGDVRLWNEFAVRQDLAVPLMYSAFLLVTLGACVRFGFGKRRVGVLLEPAEDGGTDVAIWSNDPQSVRAVARKLGMEIERNPEAE